MAGVLVVDDDLAITEGLVMLFNLDQIPAMGAFDRESAEAMVRSQFYPVILADLRLRTEEEGRHLLRTIREASPLSKIASLTGFASAEIEAELIEMGVSLVLHKPLEFAEIVSVVKEMLAVEEQLASKCPPANSEEELDLLYRTASRVLHSIPQRKYGMTSDEAEELVQQVWCLFIEKRASIRMPKAWLAGAMINLCRQEIHRKTKARAMTTPLMPDDPLHVAFTDYDHDAVMIVRDVLGRVDERTRILCELIGIQRKSYKEVSDEMGLPIGSIGPLYIRAKTRVRKLLSAAWN